MPENGGGDCRVCEKNGENWHRSFSDSRKTENRAIKGGIKSNISL